ncbi:MAG TPA: hypothetical protein VIQ00_01320 [Chitinophagaceae bacterium]|jgi:hypothetical protein
MGLSSIGSLFNSSSGCTLVVLASLWATASTPQPFSGRISIKQYGNQSYFLNPA